MPKAALSPYGRTTIPARLRKAVSFPSTRRLLRRAESPTRIFGSLRNRPGVTNLKAVRRITTPTEIVIRQKCRWKPRPTLTSTQRPHPTRRREDKASQKIFATRLSEQAEYHDFLGSACESARASVASNPLKPACKVGDGW